MPAERARWRELYSDLRKRYENLVERFNLLSAHIKQNTRVFERLHSQYKLLRSRYLSLRNLSTRAVTNLVERISKEKYPLVIDEDRHVLSVPSSFLDEIDLSREEFETSIYMDILFERYLPQPPRELEELKIDSFAFPFLLKDYSVGTAQVHPFAHFEINGKVIKDNKRKRYVYQLHAKDISSSVELEYYQRTDATITSLSLSNLHLLKAKKTIEVHKKMLISLTTSLIGEYSWETSAHLSTMQILTEFLSAECKRLGLLQVRGQDIDEFIRDLNYTSVLHDIGKVAIPSHILNKEGPLDAAEMEDIRRHPLVGASYIQRIIDEFSPDPNFTLYRPFLQIPYNICRYHHERWDGSGYPDGLAGDAIPIESRIVAVSDTYDAMRGKRPYNLRKKSHEEARAVLEECSGSQFDPAIVSAFLNIQSKFESQYFN